jgi:prepilin-type N-terminal cleavage/methylation domain-containing protein
MKYRAAIRSLRGRLPKNNQKGFTLIELLVVISILGILAAIVTMSLVGITAVATQRAAKTEQNTVQIAYDTMLADQRVNSTNACQGAPGPGGAAASDMTAFPTSAAWSVDTQGNPTSTGNSVALYPHYLREKTTHGTYVCASAGEIQQTGYTP